MTKLSVKNKESYSGLFEEFCNSSTIHGTYYWASNSNITKIIWGLIVFSGIGLAVFIIDSSFKDWEKHPIMTKVCQASVEQIKMPSITICPMEDNG